MPFTLRHRRRAFTLLELVIVIAIMVILTTLLFVYLSPKQRLDQALEAKRDVMKRELKNAIKQYTLEVGDVPIALQNKENYQPICLFGVPPSDAAGVCVSVDELVNADVLVDIPKDEIIAEYPKSGYAARVDCVGNVYVTYEGDKKRRDGYIEIDTNEDGIIDITDYQWASGDHDGDGDFGDFDDHLAYATQYQNYCADLCACQVSKQIDLVFLIDTSSLFDPEWGAFVSRYPTFNTLFPGYNISSKIYAMKTANPGTIQPTRDKIIAVGAEEISGVEALCQTLKGSPCVWDGGPADPDRYRHDRTLEAWALNAILAIQDFNWRLESTKILFILGDGPPSGGHDFEPHDLIFVNELVAQAVSNEIHLFGLPGNWDSDRTDLYGDLNENDLQEMMELTAQRTCAQVIDFNLDPEDLIFKVVQSYTAETCLINCHCLGQPNCSNGIVEAPEECDTGVDRSNTDPNACRMDCKNPSCGDSVIDTAAPWNEECDDDNAVSGDGCSSSCQNESSPLPSSG